MQRVKILYNKKDSALIQMADGNQSQLGKIKLFNLCISISGLKTYNASLGMKVTFFISGEYLANLRNEDDYLENSFWRC